MRNSGILMHISSLPSDYGIGTLGKKAYDFVDFLSAAGQSRWQVLPINPTSFGDSPYQSFSVFAGNPYFIDLQTLLYMGLLEKREITGEDWGSDPERVDYAKIYSSRRRVLPLACRRLAQRPPAYYYQFCRENAFWLEDYALFSAIKDKENGKSWPEWEVSLKKREEKALDEAKKELALQIEDYKIQQYLFYIQWKALKAYANDKKIKIIGDIPIYTALDSADVWSRPEIFMLDKDRKPVEVAGCPPDAFSAEGQLWGNPLYNWEYLKNDNYLWWIRRLKSALSTYDILRIDHFRGFESYYCIPFGSDSAKTGCWRKGPGTEFFKSAEKQLGPLPVIAEDLGILTPGVKKMLADTGYPGMKVLQFAFDGGAANEYLPHNHIKNSVVYTGTHDNDTINGWATTWLPSSVEYARRYLRLREDEGYNWGMIKAALSSPAESCVLTMQDILCLGSEARMNTPSTVGGNWQWRVRSECINTWLAGVLKEETEIYGRLPL